MEIEICKTKLSKSLINQFQEAPLDAVIYGKPLGFVVGIVKAESRTILIQHNNNYFKISMAWEKEKSCIIRRYGKVVSRRTFDTPEKQREWWNAYQRMQNGLRQIYV